jgi:hypothetical protein
MIRKIVLLANSALPRRKCTVHRARESLWPSPASVLALSDSRLGSAVFEAARSCEHRSLFPASRSLRQSGGPERDMGRAKSYYRAYSSVVVAHNRARLLGMVEIGDELPRQRGRDLHGYSGANQGRGHQGFRRGDTSPIAARGCGHTHPHLHHPKGEGTSEGGSLAGLTRRITYERALKFGPDSEGADEVVMQRIGLYQDILLQLSERARVAVVAHELAHAWLNDDVGADDSQQREAESDALARKWGFGGELEVLSEETF